MKLALWGAALMMVLVGSQRMAFATAALELVSGTSTLYVSDNGAVVCSGPGCTANPPADQNGLTGGISLAGVIFDGFSLTITTGGSNSPNCSGFPNGPGCLNTTNITATNISSGTATLSMYFADTGFMPGAGATQLVVGFSTPGETGSVATQTAYATAGNVNPLAPGNLTPTGGLSVCGTPTLTINGPAAPTALGTSCPAPGAPFSLELATTMTASPGQAFNLNGTISAVPEPVSVLLLGSVLAPFALKLRRRKAC